MRTVLAFLLLSLAGPALAQSEEPGTSGKIESPEAGSAGEAKPCVPAQLLVPPFNNTPEAMDQARIAAAAVAGEAICRTSAVAPAISELKHGAEEPIIPEDILDAETPSSEPA